MNKWLIFGKSLSNLHEYDTIKPYRYSIGESEIMSVNEKIRLIRETKGLTQEQVAEKLGISPTTYGDIERGDNDPKLSKLQKIAEIFEVPLSDLIDLGDRGTLYISFNKQGKNQYLYIGSNDNESKEQLLINELQKKELALKDKEISMQQREIENLKEIIALLKNQSQ